MPDSVEDYVEGHYDYSPEFYINFFEVCDGLAKESGRIGMLVPWTFMFKKKFQDFREDFVGSKGGFDFLAEFGYGILDNATVGTVGTVVTSGSQKDSQSGSFIRLHDIDTKQKEPTFQSTISGVSDEVNRVFEVELQEFSEIPRTPICYSIPAPVRNLHSTDKKIDASQADIEGESLCEAIPGLQTSNDDRFVRYHWVAEGDDDFQPIAKGGSEAWLVPRVVESCAWDGDGNQILRAYQSARIRNKHQYGQPGLTWTYIKRTGRRFGYYPGGLFSHTGLMLFPKNEMSLWKMMSILNSSLYHNLFLSITTERHWNPGEVGSLPWLDSLTEIDELERLAREQYRLMLFEKLSDPTSALSIVN
jgi:hypothetical protein